MFYEIHTTCKDFKEAKKIGQALIKQKLAACVNIIPKVNSIYWWNKKIVDEEESYLTLKTKDSKVNGAIKLITKLHSYKVPGISVYKINQVAPGIKKWINKTLK